MIFIISPQKKKKRLKMLLYKRDVQVIIGDSDSAIKIPNDKAKDNLKIRFSLKINQSSSGSDNMIQIYNLKDTTQSFIGSRGTRVRLLAGYGGNLSLIYDGNIDHIDYIDRHTDKVLNLYLVNKTFILTDSIFNRSYQKNVSAKTIVKDAIKSYSDAGLGVVNLDIIPDKSYSHFSFFGRTKDLLDKILSGLKIMWFVDQSTITFTKIGQNSDDESVLLTSDSGLIGYPYKSDKGINILSIFNSKIQVSKSIKLQLDKDSKSIDGRSQSQLRTELNGIYKAISVHHHGDSIDGRMVTYIEAVRNS